MTEHSTFRQNSIARAKEIVKTEFPKSGNSAVTAASIARSLCRLCAPGTLDASVDNLFALRDPSNPTSVDRPFAHGMVLRLLHLLFDQTVKNCNTSVKELLRLEFVGKPLSVIPVVYAISLVRFEL
jgi:hypothetical protein